MINNYSPSETRFFNKVVKRSDGCWQWTGGKKKAGYGNFQVDGKKVITHRWAYEHFREPIPVGFEIDHLCRNRSCVNPDHLEAISLQENRQRRNDHRTHCRNGHPYNSENTRMQLYPDGYTCRVCKICSKTVQKRLYMQAHPNFGQPHPCNKLTAADIPGIRARLANGESQRSIARDLGVIQQTVSQIARGKTWTHVL